MLPKKITLKSGEQILIRKALETDAENLIKYINKVAGQTDFLTFGGGEFSKTIEQERKIISDIKNSSDMIFLIAELDGKIAGILDLQGKNKPRLKHSRELGITVLQKHWNKGIGTALMETLLNWAKTVKTIRKINLLVYTHNQKAIKLYQKLGFKIEGTLKRDTYIKNKFHDSHMMGILID